MPFSNGKFKYEVMDNWAKHPRQWAFGEIADVAVDRNDNVYLFSHRQRPVMVF